MGQFLSNLSYADNTCCYQPIAERPLNMHDNFTTAINLYGKQCCMNNRKSYSSRTTITSLYNDQVKVGDQIKV